jgi:predicted RNA-binding protein with PUA-like domain
MGCTDILFHASSHLSKSQHRQRIFSSSSLCHNRWMIAYTIVSIVSIGLIPRVTTFSLPTRYLSRLSYYRHQRYFSLYSHSKRMSTLSTDSDENQHYLLKSEPNEYSIQQLCQDHREEWNGVRNYTARNHLQTMKEGNRCFFYHSSCKTPSIVGTCIIARTAQPDPTAVDPTHKIFDPKSIHNNKSNNNNNSNNNRWVSVLVEFEEQFETPITIQELRAQAIINPVVANMTLLRRPRLSVMPISSEEWQAVLNLQSRKERGEDLLQVQQPLEQKESRGKKRPKSRNPPKTAAVKKQSTNVLNIDDLGYCSHPDRALSTNQIQMIVEGTAIKVTEKDLGLTGRKHLYKITDGSGDNLESILVDFFQGNKFIGKDMTRLNRMIEAISPPGHTNKQGTSNVYVLLSENSSICKRNTLPKLLEDGVIVQRVA